MWQTTPTKKKPARGSFFALLFLVPLLAVPLGCSKPPDEEPPPNVVSFGTAEGLFLQEWTEFVGTTMPLPNRMKRITARVEGTVASVLKDAKNKTEVAEGQQVAEGTVLVQLDTTVVDNNIAEAKATQEALEEEQKQAQLAVDEATREVNRLKKLTDEDDRRALTDKDYVRLVSPPEREKASNALKDAQSKLKASANRLTAGKKRLEALEMQREFHTLRAPIAGKLGALQVVPGQVLSVGTSVVDVLDIAEEIDVLCFVPASLVGQLKVDQKARTGEAGEDATSIAEREEVGSVIFINDQAEQDTGNFKVKVRFPNTKKLMRANSVVHFCVRMKAGKECPSLPEEAIQEDTVPPTVVLVMNVKTEKNKEGKEDTKGVAHRMNVELGLRDRQKHQIEIVRITDPDTESKTKVQVVVSDNQLLLDGKDAEFVKKGAQGFQTGDILKKEAEDEPEPAAP